MTGEPREGAREAVDAVYRAESRRVLATLIRLLGDFDLAEEALHDAFAAAVEQWPRDGVPAKPRAWLVTTGRFRAIDRLRAAPTARGLGSRCRRRRRCRLLRRDDKLQAGGKGADAQQHAENGRSPSHKYSPVYMKGRPAASAKATAARDGRPLPNDP